MEEKERSKKNQYCKKCGSQIDKNKKCTGCGKQYFKFNIRIFSLIIIFVTLISIITVEGYYIYSEQKIMKEKEQSMLSEKEEMLEKLKKYITYSANTSEELLFWYKNAVIVSNDKTKKYHNYGCEDLMLNSFWIYNTEAAEGKGYTMCKKCYNKKEDSSNLIYYIPLGVGIDKMKYLDD